MTPSLPATPTHPSGRWLTTTQAAARLGVKADTLYAYVSRGLLHPDRVPGSRASRFDPAEIERLAARGRRAELPAGLVIESSLTTITNGMLYYRGLPATVLARSRSFEDVAEWLWSGAFPARSLWGAADRTALSLGVAAYGPPLPGDMHPLDRLRLIAAGVATRDRLGSAARRAPNLTVARATARALLAALVDCLPVAVEPLPPHGPGRPSRSVTRSPALSAAAPDAAGQPATPASLTERLWTRLSPAPAAPGGLAALNAAMVLLADHGLTASTLAARAAASVRADLYAVVSAGLAVAGGAWHAGAARAVEAMLAGIAAPADAPAALDDRLRRGALPGFGHPLYPGGDPRAAVLLEMTRAADLSAERPAISEAVLAAARARGLPPPNVDFALAALACAGGMIPGAAEVIFAVARTAGWIAHAIEGYEQGAVIRPRALYTGPPPQPSPPAGAVE